MTPFTWKCAVLFGGSGTCGAHLAEYLATAELADEILLVDLVAPRPGAYTARFDELLRSGRIRYLQGDVREPLIVLDVSADLIVNLAAIHREPGHESPEYFATNLPGAKNVCEFARQHGCNDMIFVSSVAVYGTHEGTKTESSAPTPTSAYGESKVLAEDIHREWLGEDESRRLAIVRPGVVFGPGERANVTRLVRGVVRRRFAYVGGPEIKKAGLYVGEFARATVWAIEQARAGKGNRGPRELLANLTAHPVPTVREYVEAVGEVANVRPFVPTIPLPLAVVVSSFFYSLAGLLGIRLSIHPERVRKLARHNEITPQTLLDGGYQPRYPLREAMREWRTLRPDEWK